jgi:predicted N-acetyltransferase YhbS
VSLHIGPLTEHDLASADQVFRVAFGTRNGMAEPLRFDGDAARIATRWRSAHVVTLGATVDGAVVASILATMWGQFAWIGPLSVRPDHWEQNIGQRLLEATIPAVERLGCRHLALFTISDSPKHLALYHKFGFWPRFLTALMHKNVAPTGGLRTGVAFSEGAERQRMGYLEDCRALTSQLYDGLDVSEEILTVHQQTLGETILIIERGKVAAFAICHSGPGTEAGTGTTYVKFAAVSPGPGAAGLFERLLTELDAFAARRGTPRLLAGVNTARRHAYGLLIEKGFRSVQQGVAMHRPDEPAYDRPDVYAIDDLR